MTFKDIAKGWVEAGCKLVDDNKDNPQMYTYGVKTALNTMLENFAEVPVIEWHPYPEEKPAENAKVIVQYKDNDMFIDEFVEGDFYWNPSLYYSVVAWAEVPRPYKETT